MLPATQGDAPAAAPLPRGLAPHTGPEPLFSYLSFALGPDLMLPFQDPVL